MKKLIMKDKSLLEPLELEASIKLIKPKEINWIQGKEAGLSLITGKIILNEILKKNDQLSTYLMPEKGIDHKV